MDDCSRRTWIYLLHVKSEALKFFKEFKAKVELVGNRRSAN